MRAYGRTQITGVGPDMLGAICERPSYRAARRLCHWRRFASATQTGLSCPGPDRACVPIPVPRRDPTVGMSPTPVGRMLPSR